MRIGFVSIYSWRPHVEHLYYLADMLKHAGHETEFLTCDGDLPACYTREIRNIRPDWQECLMCRVGGVRSFASENVTSIGKLSDEPLRPSARAVDFAKSSASTLGRFESDEDFSSERFKALVDRLAPSTELAFQAASKWIEEKSLDALIVFNGRMDATRAIFEAALHKDIPAISLERTWFGDGLQLLPNENCLGLRATHKLVEEWSAAPLTSTQAKKAAGYIASRFLRKNQNEWRAYNLNADIKPWPVEKGVHKILLIPGSLNEIWGHPDWTSAWKSPIEAYDALIEHFKLSPEDLVLRCHPNWGEKIGKVDGHLAEELYTAWARRRGIHVVPSTSSVSTLGLIEQAEVIIVASGSAALEAGALGKQIIGIATANYQKAGIREEACDIDQLRSLKLRAELTASEVEAQEARVRRNTLRFCYTITHRVPQYVDQVRLETTTQYRYVEGGQASRLIEMINTGRLTPDDATCAENTYEEDEVVEQMRSKRWADLIHPDEPKGQYISVNRRPLFRWIDGVRARLRHGDR